MAPKKRRHGKVEARQVKARLRFQPGVIIGIVLLVFAACFALYMVTATSQADYWEREIIGSANGGSGSAGGKGKAGGVTNPVPSSERADESRMEACAFIGDVTEFTSYYKTTAGMVFTDAVSSMSESRMKSIGRSLAGVSPTAVYIWYQCPEDLEASASAMAALAENLQEQLGSTPLYILTATPSADIDENQRIDTWNAALFSLADEKGLYYVDISTTLKANDGTLSATYQDENTLYTTVGDQILTHVAD